MVNCVIERVEILNIRNNSSDEISEYRVTVSFFGDRDKPFRIMIVSAELRDENGNTFEHKSGNDFFFPIGTINFFKPRFYFMANGKPLGSGAQFIITLVESNSEKPQRFLYTFEDGIGKYTE